MLDEAEWGRITPLLVPGDHEAALQLYEQMTGYRETNINAVAHHRAAYFGPPCNSCGKPLRTPQARFCAACGAEHAVS